MLNTETNRRLYISFLASSAVALLLIRLFVFPQVLGDQPSALEVLPLVTDALLGAALASLIVSAFVLFLFRDARVPIAEAVVIDPKEISRELLASAQTTDTWYYRGHTGRYFRTAILPTLAAAAREHGRYITVNVQLLDPDDADAVAFFVRYRRTVNAGRADYWTVARARAEIATTILALQDACAGGYSRISCEVAVASVVSPFTTDMSAELAVVTRESSTDAALKYPRGGTFFDSANEDLRLSRRQATAIELSPCEIRVEHTAASVRSRLTAIGLLTDAGDDVCAMIVDALRNPVNPYPNGR